MQSANRLAGARPEEKDSGASGLSRYTRVLYSGSSIAIDPAVEEFEMATPLLKPTKCNRSRQPED